MPEKETVIDPPQPQSGVTPARVGNYRWTICALLFFATTINYVDRQVLGILAPYLQKSLGWSEVEYGDIMAAFQAAYAIGLVASGWVIDRVGTRRGLAGALVFWSVAAMAHALAFTARGFGEARFALGLGEAGIFPACIKTVSEWFPKKERALATGLLNSGTNVGAVVAPLIVPWIALTYGWRWAFIATGALGFIWLAFWLVHYRTPEDHPRLSKEELAYIQSDPPEAMEKIPWIRLIPLRQTWAFALGKFLTDPVWWFYLGWLPKYLNKTHGLTLDKIGLPLVVIYVMADFGSIGGGWLSSSMIARGFSVNVSRKSAMFICALCVTPIMILSHASTLWVAVLLIGLAAAAHQGWSANLYTLVSDTLPRRAVASVIGFGGMAGAVGGMLVATATGYLLQSTGGNYTLLFLIAGCAYLFALLVVHLINPRLQPAHFPDPTGSTTGEK